MEVKLGFHYDVLDRARLLQPGLPRPQAATAPSYVVFGTRAMSLDPTRAEYSRYAPLYNANSGLPFRKRTAPLAVRGHYKRDAISQTHSPLWPRFPVTTVLGDCGSWQVRGSVWASLRQSQVSKTLPFPPANMSHPSVNTPSSPKEPRVLRPPPSRTPIV